MANTQVNITANGKTTLKTAGKYCDRNIDVNVNVEGGSGVAEFTNVLKHESTTITLNKYAGSASEITSNGDIAVYLDLVALGFNTHPAELTFRWRGMDVTINNMALYLSQDKSTWSALDSLYNNTLDGYGDNSLNRKINYPASNRYLKMSFRVKYNGIAVTQEDVDKCILTINEPIGNTIEGIVPTGTLSVTKNGTYDVSEYASAAVNIPASGITPTGTKSITSNGTYDITEYASAEVNVPASGITPTGTKNITENGTHDVTQYANVNVDVPAQPTQFTNILKQSGCTVNLNKGVYVASEPAINGYIAVYLDLVALGFNTHPAELTIRWRGMSIGAYLGVFISTDNSTYTAVDYLYNATKDEHGDFQLYRKVNYPTTNRYLKFSFMVKGNKIAVTQADVDQCILTINEPIGNGGYAG